MISFAMTSVYDNTCVQSPLIDVAKILNWLKLAIWIFVIFIWKTKFRDQKLQISSLGSSKNPDTILNLMRTNCLSVLLYNLEAVHLTKTNIHDLSFPMNRSYVKIFYVRDKTSISMCQFYTNQLTVEMLVDSKRLWYLMKLQNSDCSLLSHVFEISSRSYIEALMRKYEINSVNSRKLTKPAIMKNIWNKFYIMMNLWWLWGWRRSVMLLTH